MSTKVSLMEAASFLGVSKATLRNWDNDGKLTANRNPLNGYRQYDLDELIALKRSLQGDLEEEVGHIPDTPEKRPNIRSIKRVVNKMHNIIRDSDANSNIVTRFDEISKLLFLRLMTGKASFRIIDNQTPSDYASIIQKNYVSLIKKSKHHIPEKFGKILLSDNAIYECGKSLYSVDIDDNQIDVKGLAYEDTIRGTFDKSDNQQYFTPHQIVDFMVSALVDSLNGTVCDPACGTAGFLTKAAEKGASCLFGMEVDERLAWVSTLNLLIHGNDNFDVKYLSDGGSLGKEASIFYNSVDTILTNPPFGSDYTDSKILNNYILGKDRTSRRRGVLFIEQAWNLLKDGGIVAIIIDQGVLNSSTNTDVRKYILTHYNIRGIIDLPESAFLPYANVSSSILILQKKTTERPQAYTFFAKASNIGRKSNGDDDLLYESNGDSRLNSDLPKILEDWYRYLNNDFDMQYAGCFIANVNEYREEDKSLRLDYMFHHPVRYESKALLNTSKTDLVTLAEICEERNQTYIPAADSDATSILFTGLANIESYTGIAIQEFTPAASIKSSVKRYEPGDIVFSKMRPALRKVAVMNTAEGGYVSSECSVFTIRKDLQGQPIVYPEILSALLRSDFVYGQIMPYVTGIGRPRISNKDLRKIKIPLPDKNIQKIAMQSLYSNQECVRQLKNKAIALNEEAESLESKMINDVAVIMTGGK